MMIEDFGTCTGGAPAEFECDLCIIGAGAAGITLARSLKDNGLEILLLESGGADYEAEIQDLAAGRSSGEEYYDLRESRLRFFGGTTAIWGGRVAQLDAIDFKKREWVAHSGWPLTKEELREDYRAAQALLDLPAVDDNELPGFKDPFNHEVLQTAAWQFDTMFDRFTLRRCQDLIDADKVKILLHATAIAIDTNESGNVVETIQIANLHGGKGQVKARAVVVATGGLEVPRLLLSSKTKAHPQGIGNNTDLVGRFFMEHPHARAAHVKLQNPKAFFEALPRFKSHKGARYGLLFRPGDEWQKEQEILNSGFTLAVRKHPDEGQVMYKRVYNRLRHDLSPTRTGRTMWKMTKAVSNMVQDRLGSYMNVAKLQKQAYGLYAVMRAEQAPCRDSRVMLGEKKDALGMPEIDLRWCLSNIDKHTVDKSMEALDHELRRLGLGMVEKAGWLANEHKNWEVDPLVSNHAIGGYHHMGTTRMHEDEAHGVVDRDSRVHGVENLYIAGSSVFPTGGWANPTLTILALSLRLGRLLRSVYG